MIENIKTQLNELKSDFEKDIETLKISFSEISVLKEQATKLIETDHPQKDFILSSLESTSFLLLENEKMQEVLKEKLSEIDALLLFFNKEDHIPLFMNQEKVEQIQSSLDEMLKKVQALKS